MSGAPKVFADPAIDALLRMMLELASETWVTRVRLAALEAKVGSVEDFVLPADMEAAVAAEREAFVAKIFAVLES